MLLCPYLKARGEGRGKKGWLKHCLAGDLVFLVVSKFCLISFLTLDKIEACLQKVWNFIWSNQSLSCWLSLRYPIPQADLSCYVFFNTLFVLFAQVKWKDTGWDGGSGYLGCLLRKSVYANIRCKNSKSSNQLLEIIHKSGNIAFEVITYNMVSTASILFKFAILWKDLSC